MKKWITTRLVPYGVIGLLTLLEVGWASFPFRHWATNEFVDSYEQHLCSALVNTWILLIIGALLGWKLPERWRLFILIYVMPLLWFMENNGVRSDFIYGNSTYSIGEMLAETWRETAIPLSVCSLANIGFLLGWHKFRTATQTQG